MIAIVGTGLRELRSVERWALGAGDSGMAVERLHFTAAIRAASPHILEVITLSNACSAGGHALALAQDILLAGEADAVVVAAADSMTESMLAMIGRFRDSPAQSVRPFDCHRDGVLLGEGAAAVVLAGGPARARPLARLLGTGLSCDAHHETAPQPEGIRGAIKDALYRAELLPEQVDFLVAHGTGTILNDPLEAQLIREVFARSGPGPWITAVKGAVGHTSGASALVSLDVAVRCLQTDCIPPAVGLMRPLADNLRFVTHAPLRASIRVGAVNAFGFGGVNAVSLIEKAA